MFERFTDRARRSIVLAQEEARGLQHNYIGTEHLLLGLIHEGQGVAARAVARSGLTLEGCREAVLAIIGRGSQPQVSHIPFTPRAKKCLELALREALALGHDYIGTEHVLLAIMTEGEGVAAQLLAKREGGLPAIRNTVLNLLPAATSGETSIRLRRTAVARRFEVQQEAEGAPPASPAADKSLAEAARLAAGSPLGSHHLLLAALSDPDSAATRTLTGLGLDLDRAREALRGADVTGSSDELPEDAGRRQMLVTVTADRVIVEARDPAIVAAGRAAVAAVAGEGGDGTIRGDDPAAAVLSGAWQALHDSLTDIRRRPGLGQLADDAASEPPAPE